MTCDQVNKNGFSHQIVQIFSYSVCKECCHLLPESLLINPIYLVGGVPRVKRRVNRNLDSAAFLLFDFFSNVFWKLLSYPLAFVQDLVTSCIVFLLEAMQDQLDILYSASLVTYNYDSTSTPWLAAKHLMSANGLQNYSYKKTRLAANPSTRSFIIIYLRRRKTEERGTWTFWFTSPKCSQ